MAASNDDNGASDIKYIVVRSDASIVMLSIHLCHYIAPRF